MKKTTADRDLYDVESDAVKGASGAVEYKKT
jgi:hypothetical protein